MARASEETVLAVKMAEAYWPASPAHCDTKKNAIQIADDAATLKSIARSLHRLMEKACNGYQHEADEARAEKRVARLSAAATKIAAEYGITKVIFNGDPRGYAVKLHFPDGRGNTWGGDEAGWGI